MFRAPLKSVLLAAILLSGCSQPEESTIGPGDGDGDGSSSGFKFNKNDPSNTVGFVYDDPIVGLTYVCKAPDGNEFRNRTDEVADFVCPDASEVRLQAGRKQPVTLGTIRLAEMTESDRMAIPLATVFGSFANEQTRTLVNTVILLQSFARSGDRGGYLVLPGDFDRRIDTIRDFSLAMSPDDFVDLIAPAVARAELDYGTRTGGVPMTVADARALVGDILRRSYAGIYRSEAATQGSNGYPSTDTRYRAMSPGYTLLVQRNGTVRGLGLTQMQYRNEQGKTFLEYGSFALRPAAFIDSDRYLGGFRTDVDSTYSMVFTGRFIGYNVYPSENILTNAYNDTLQGTATVPLPEDYLDRFDVLDAGDWRQTDVKGIERLDGEIGLTRFAAASPFLDPSIIPPGTLPVHYRIERVSFDDGLKVDQEDRFDNDLLTPEPPIHITIAEDGAILSDVDQDCSPVDRATMRDGDGTPEDYVGLLGREARIGGRPYATISLMVADRNNADFGLILGMPPMVVDGADFARFNFEKMRLEPSYGCSDDDGHACITRVGWVNDMKSVDVLKGIYNGRSAEYVTNHPDEVDAKLRVPGYVGRLTTGSGPTVCPP